MTTYDFHPLADMFPLMEGEDLDALVADIKANGLLENMILYEGMILDGRNRYLACKAAGVEVHYWHFYDLNDRLDPATYVISANLHRRHLTAEQKREVIAKLIEAQPEKSDRQIAKEARADHKTVGTVRRRRKQLGRFPQLINGSVRTARRASSRSKSRRRRAGPGSVGSSTARSVTGYSVNRRPPGKS
jgi:hypothetical protein